ncbi:hypothetical protein FDECE_9365 [Fusarium decemcellulare]|nr:hypothetical protein FDECE_9365 [Fusarium decemcellulare]
MDGIGALKAASLARDHAHRPKELRARGANSEPTVRGLSQTTATVVYKNLQRIAEAYGLAASEFEYYCTIPAPRRVKAMVFYPFHVLSKPQARGNGWGWLSMRNFAAPENAGLGESHVTATHLVYWMCAHLCDQVRVLKGSRPDASREEIAFSILDRWGLPCVPWKYHTFKASLCKKKGHRIAIMLGIANVPDKDFDPVQYIDLGWATVTIDSTLSKNGDARLSTDCYGHFASTAKLIQHPGGHHNHLPS